MAISSSVLSAAPCGECHDAEPDPAAFAGSVHAVLDCADCHSGTEDFPHAEEAARVDCAMCHEEIVEEYGGSIHGRARANGETDAPSCNACHGDVHAIRSFMDPESSVHPARLPQTCGSCHSDPEMVRKYGIPVAKPMAAYAESVHAAGVDGATCSSCHGSHAIFGAADPRSKVFHARVPDTCGQCHGQITETYKASVHGKAAAHGAREAPVCTDCHGEHRILSPRTKSSPVYATNIPKMTCGRCHGDLRLADKYDIPGRAVDTYRDSYHGLASRGGKVTVANCSSCHGVHDILPSSDPASHIHKDHLAATCGSCHPGAGKRFAIGKVHVDPAEAQHAAVYWVRWLYLWLIYVTIGGMLLHNGLDMYRKTRKPLPRYDLAAPRRQRMSLGFRAAHWTLIGSFVVLVYSGFALTYPESRWAAPLLRWEETLGLRGWLHRGAAILMLGALVLHAIHLAIDRRARACMTRMRPTLHDVTELRERLLWYLGRRPSPPKSPSLGYVEKAEYIALMWGIVVMTVTGFFLWFENVSLRLFPKWFSDLATVIHFYEAVLATLAIVVWHLYFVIFDPVVYPMDTAWITGRESPGRALEREYPEDEAASTSGPDRRRAAARRSLDGKGDVKATAR